jgi:hypothetical protein
MGRYMRRDDDYSEALAYLDYEFPGTRYDDSMIEYLEGRRKIKEIKTFLAKAAICVSAALVLLVITAKLFPFLLIVFVISAVRR